MVDSWTTLKRRPFAGFQIEFGGVASESQGLTPAASDPTRLRFPLPSQHGIGQHSPMTKTPPADQLWFLDSLVTIRVSTSDGQDGMSILEHFVPHGSSPPLHFHRTED